MLFRSDPWGEGIHSNQPPCPVRNEERILRAYAVARYRAIQLANGDGRIDEEESPGGWSGAKIHKVKAAAGLLSG